MNRTMLKIMMGLAMMSGDMSDSSQRLAEGGNGAVFHNYQHKERPKGKRAKRRAKAKMKGGPK